MRSSDEGVEIGARRRQAVTPTSVLLVSSLGVFMAFIDATIVNVAFPDIQKSFPGASLSELSWVLNAYNVVFAAFLVPAGRISDLLGRRRVFGAGVLLFTLASVLCAIAPSLDFLIAARVIQALGAATMVPASLALVLDAYGPLRRAHAVALWSAIAAIAAGLGPAIGGLLVQADSWRLTFLVNVPLGILAYVLAGRRLVESRAPGRRSLPDLPGAVVLVFTIALLTVGIVEGPEWGWTSPGVLVAWGLAIVLGAIFVRRCTWHRSPVIDLELLRVRGFAVANGLSLLAGAGYFAYLLCNVLFLTRVWGYSELDAGLALTPAPFVAAAVARPLARMIDRIGYAGVATVGGVIWAGGVALLVTAVGPHPDFVGQWLPIMVVLGVGAGATLPTLGAAAVAAAPGARFATATALNSVARQLGAVLGVALLVAIVGTPDPRDPQAVLGAFDDGWKFAACCLAAIAVLAWTMGHITRPSESKAGDDDPAGPHVIAMSANGAAPVAAVPAPDDGAEPEHLPGDVLAEVSIFRELDAAQRREIAQRGELVELAAGTHLFRQGDVADALYVVLAGRCEVHRDGDLLVTAGRGAVLGELALISGGVRSAAVRARRDSRLLRLGQAEFERLLRDEPGFALGLTRELTRQLQESRPRELPTTGNDTTVVLVPLGLDVDVEGLARELVADLQAWESIAWLRPPAAGQSEDLAAALEAAERRHDRVILTCGMPEPGDAWSEFCLRQADRVITVAGAGAPPAWLRRQPALLECDLVLTDAVGASDDWLGELWPRVTHRVRDGRADDVARMARRLAGRSVGLVLSGGGARGLAHIGVIEELLAAGIVIDRVGGSSMGAFIGALFASGMDPDEIDACCYDEWVRRNPLSDYRIPRVSLIRGDRVREMLLRTLPGRIEQLPLEFYCVSVDLLAGRQEIHRSGWLAYAVSASMCLPGLAPPVADGGRFLVDGGALNNLPVDEMAARREGPVIAVDVTARLTDPSTVETSRRQRMDPGWEWDDTTPLPTIAETLNRVVLLGSIDTAEAARKHADLVVLPENDGAGILEFHQIDAMRASGRRAARAALEHAPAALLGRVGTVSPGTVSPQCAPSS